VIPDELIDLYEFCDGSDAELLENYHLLSVEEAVGTYHFLRRNLTGDLVLDTQPHWLPILQDDGRNFYVVDCTKGPNYGSVLYDSCEFPVCTKYPSVSAMLESITRTKK
jgi:hypothetical protein